jgi:hypothetical protein
VQDLQGCPTDTEMMGRQRLIVGGVSYALVFLQTSTENALTDCRMCWPLEAHFCKPCFRTFSAFKMSPAKEKAVPAYRCRDMYPRPEIETEEVPLNVCYVALRVSQNPTRDWSDVYRASTA